MRILNMFDTLFGWREASKCKKLIRHVQCRLKILKNKRESIIRQIHGDVVELIKKGDDHAEFARVEQLLRDQNIKDVYDQLDNFSELIILRLPFIRKHKYDIMSFILPIRDCPRDIHEAVSSLLYASLVCGDLPELKRLRKLFGKRYGNTFVRMALNLLPGNLVNQEIVEKVRQKNISDDVKFRLVKEIARKNDLQLRPPDIEMKCRRVGNILLLTNGIEWEESSCKETEGAQFQTSNDTVDNSLGDPTPTQPSSKEERLCLSNEAELSHDRFSRLSICQSSNPRKPDKIIEATDQIFERINVYQDDIAEFRPTRKEDEKGGDQRFFMFKSPTPPPKCGANRRSLDSLYDRKTRASTESCKSFSTKGGNSKARNGGCVSVEDHGCNSSMSTISSMKDAEFAMYHCGGGGVDFSPSKSLNPTKHQYKKNSVENRRSSSCCRKDILSAYPQERNRCVKTGESNLKQQNCECQWKIMYDKDFNQLMACDRCLKCYFSVSCNDTDMESPPRQSSMIPRFVKPSRRNFQHGEYEGHRNCYNSSEEAFVPGVVTNLTTYSAKNKGDNVQGRKSKVGVSFETDKQNEHRKEAEEVNLSDCPVSFASSSATFVQAQQSPYKSVENLSLVPYKPLQVNQSNGGSSSGSHVHPKLPDYEDLVSKFMALKMEKLQR